MRNAARLLAATAFVMGAQAASAQADTAPELVTRLVRPDVADSSVHRFLAPNYVVFVRGVRADAPLLVFMPGTGGAPLGTTDFANAAARQGYRVIGLEYDDVPAVAQLCPRDPDPDCAGKVRRKRIFGDDVTSRVDDRREESIENRLVHLLALLVREHPDEGWGRYLRDGHPDWTHIAVSGLSQGAGMAAYIAREREVARAILFSSPWDSYGRSQTLAPWVHGSGATPVERWYGAFHRREPNAAQIARAYDALGIPSSHVHIFDLDPAPRAPATAFHPSVVGNGPTPRLADGTPAYLPDWQFLLGDVRQP